MAKLTLCLFLWTCATAAARLEVPITDDCSYSILVDGAEWFSGGVTALVSGGALYASDDSLRLVRKSGNACDWALPGADRVVLTTEVVADGDSAVFRQTFPRGLANPRPAAENGSGISGFPALRASRRRLDAVSYAGCQLQDSARIAWPPATDEPPPGAVS